MPRPTSTSSPAPTATAPLLPRLLGLALALGLAVLSGCSAFESKPTGRPVVLREEPDIRVRLKKNALSARVDGPARMIVRASTLVRAEAVQGPLTFRGTVNGMVMTDASGRERSFAPGTDVEILPREMTEAERRSSDGYKPGDALVLDGDTNPGFLVIHPKSDQGGVIDVIGVMPIEAYLPGVLSKELFATWPRQAFEAQAVAARTYALHERDRSRRLGELFDVESTTKDQVFGGLSSLPVAVEAARATRGMVVTESDSGYASRVLLRTYYSSTCGGEQTSARDIFPITGASNFNAAKPLQAQRREHFCQSSTRYRWLVTRSVDDLTLRLRAFGNQTGLSIRSIGRLKSVEGADPNVTGRPTRYIVTDDQGRTFRLSPEELRNAANFAGPGTTGLAPITAENRFNSGNVEITIAAGDARIAGKGFGHGVGMCQFCAKGMAEAGWDWPRMMRAFYPTSGTMKAY